MPHADYRVVAGAEEARAGGRRARSSVRRQAARPAGPARAVGRRRSPRTWPLRSSRRSRRRAGNVALVEKLVAGPELTVNAFSLDGEFVPLTVTDRVIAEPPAFGVALAHVWPSELAAGDRRGGDRRRARGSRGARDRERTDVHAGARRAETAPWSASSPRGSEAATTPSSAWPRSDVDLNGLALAAALGDEIPRDALVPDETVGGACIRFLVAPEGELEAVDGVERGRGRRRRRLGARLPRARRGDRAAAARIRPRRAPCSPSARAARTPSPGVSEPPGAYAFGSSMSTPPSSRSSTRRETFLGFQPPAIGEEEIAAVTETLRSGWLTTGPSAAELERRFAEYAGATHALAVASGTAAMHLALVALGIGPGDEVITTPITWPATANVVVHAGATPVFADVRPADLNIDPDHVAALVGPRTKAILPVHLAGQPADLDPLWALGLPVIEDAAHAVESAYRGRKIGALSEATCFSLYATKNVAAGEGGIVTTSSDEVARAIEELRLMRRGRRVALRHRRARLQGEPVRRTRGDRALPARQARPAPGDPRRAVRGLRRGGSGRSTGSSRSRATARDTHALHLYIVRIDAGAGGRDARRVPAGADRGADRHEHPLPARPPAERIPRALSRAGSRCRSPSAPATRCCRCRSRPLTRSDDIEDAIDAIRRVHERFTGG